MPTFAARLLIGSEFDAVTAATLGRVAGAALLALGLACWPVGRPAGNVTPALRAMLTYNSLGGALYFIYLGINGEWGGVLLWPAAALHGVLSLVLAHQWKIAVHRK